MIGSPQLSTAVRIDASKYASHLNSQITARIEAAEIAPLMLRAGADLEHDRVHVRVKLSPTGQLLSRSVLMSSGDAAVDAAMLAAVDRAQPFAPPPEAIAALRDGIIVALMLPDASANSLPPNPGDK